MTAPTNLPAPPAINTGNFGGHLVPPDVQARILNLLVDSAPFANSLTRLPTRSNRVIFPVAKPSGAGWIAELERIPLMNLGDDAYVVAIAKLAGLLDVSNETILDGDLSLTNQFRTLLQDSLGPDLDAGLLNGEGPPEPAGVLAVAEAVAGASLFAAANAAKGEIADSGGAASVLAASGAALAAADGATASDGQLLFPGGVASALGLQAVVVPELPTALVYDRTRMFTIVNRELSSVDISTDFRFEYDATTFRVKARVACACPDPAKAIRKVTVAGAVGTSGAARSPAKKTAT